MALEGIELNPGSGGQKIATDTVAGLDFQIIKIGVGVQDATPTSVSVANPMPVNVLSLIPGTGATSLGKAVDAPAGATDTGVPPLAIRDDILTTLTPVDGNYVPLRTSNVGSLWVDIFPSSNTFAKKVDDPAGGADKGVAVLAVRDDALSALVPVEGDYTFLRVNSTGALHVTGGGGGTEYNEDDVTPATIVGGATLVERDDVLSAVIPVEGDWIGLRGTAEGALWVQDFNSDAILADMNTIAGAVSGSEMQVDVVAPLPAGTNAIGKLSANSGVDIGDVDVLSVTPGSAAANLGKAEDAAHTTGDVGVMALAVRRDVDTSLVDLDGDYVPFQVDNTGKLKVEIFDGGDSHTVDGTVTADAGTGTFNIQATAALPASVRLSDGTAFYDGTKTGQLPGALLGGHLDVQIAVALPTGTNNIGDVDVLTLPANASINLNQVGGVAVVTGGVAGSQGVGGLAANGVAVAGNPILIGGFDGTNAQIIKTPFGRLELVDDFTMGDATSNVIGHLQASATGRKLAVAGCVFNGTTWDRMRGDTSGLHVSQIIPGVAATHLGKAVDAIAGATDTGIAALAIRDDALTALTPIDGDYVPLRVNSTGALHVTGGGGGTEYNEDDVTPNPIVGTATLIERDDALATVTPAEGDWLGLRGTAEGALWVQDFNSDTISSNTTTLAGAVSGSEMQVDIVAALPAGTNAIGKLAANSGVDIGDVDVISQPARAATTDNVGAKLATDAIMDGTTSLTPKRALIAATTSGDTVVVAGVGGKKIRVLSLAINAFGDANVEFQDAATATSRSGLFDMGTSSGKAKGLVLAFSPVGHFETASGVGLDINLSAAVTVEGHLVYVEV